MIICNIIFILSTNVVHNPTKIQICNLRPTWTFCIYRTGSISVAFIITKLTFSLVIFINVLPFNLILHNFLSLKDVIMCKNTEQRFPWKTTFLNTHNIQVIRACLYFKSCATLINRSGHHQFYYVKYAQHLYKNGLLCKLYIMTSF